jgi:hypothetical protein
MCGRSRALDELVLALDFGGALRRMVYVEIQASLVSRIAELRIIFRNRQYYIFRRGLRLPSAGPVQEFPLAVGSVALAITVVSQWLLNGSTNGSTKEVPMSTNVSGKIVRNSVLQVIVATGTAAVGGLLAA